MSTRTSILTEDAVTRLIDATAGERHAHRDRAILELAYGSGLRAGELSRLHVEELDLEHASILVFGKGLRSRRVPLTRKAIAALRAHLQGRRMGPVFTSAWHRPLSNRLIERIVAKYTRKAGLEDHPSPHTLRHSFASHLLHRGASLFDVKALLGHAHVTTTAIYCHELDHLDALDRVHRTFHPRA